MPKNGNSAVSFVETPKAIAELMVSLITKSTSSLILDTGCGKGVFIECLKNMGYSSIEGIELNSELAHYCLRRHTDVKIYNADFLTWHPSQKYDVIIGNPPYLHYNSLPVKVRENVEFLTKTKETDIYYAFIVKAIELLKHEGELIYIVPYSFFYATYAQRVREKLLSNGFLELVIDLDEVKLFSGENPETIIFKFAKEQREENPVTKVLLIKTRKTTPNLIKKKATEALLTKRENELFYYHEKKFSIGSAWSTFQYISIPQCVLLHDIAFVGVGMVSGFDDAFRLDDKGEEFIQQYPEIVIPFVKGENCKGFWVDGKNYYLLLNEEQVSSEEILKEKYPEVYAYLLPFKTKMQSRFLPANKKWFQWQALRNFKTYKKLIGSYKIFVPTLDRSKENRFSITNNPYYPSGDVLAIIPQNIDPFFLLGFLNSTFFRNYYLSEGARRGNRIAYTQRLLANIKIPKLSRKIIDNISQITRTILSKKDVSLREKIDAILEKELK